MDIREMLERVYNRATALTPSFKPELPKIVEIMHMPFPMAYDSRANAILVRSDTPAAYSETALFAMVGHEMGELFYHKFHEDENFQKKFPSVTENREKFADEFGARIAGVDAMITLTGEFDKNTRMKPKNIEVIREQMGLGPEISAENIIAYTTERLRNVLKLSPDSSELEVWSAYKKRAKELELDDDGYPTPFERVQALEGLRKEIGPGRDLPILSQGITPIRRK